MERKPRAYKIADKPYEKAKKRMKGALAPTIEMFVTYIADGCKVFFTDWEGKDKKIFIDERGKTKSSNKTTK